MKWKYRISNVAAHRYLLTVVWLTMAFTIGFVETPLRFTADIPRIHALQIGHRVFHALNYFEIAFAVGLLSSFLIAPTARRQWLIFSAIAIILAIQTILLFSVLDARTLAIIAGRDPGPSPYHLTYILLELVKLLLLAIISWLLVLECRQRPRANSNTG